MPSDIPSQEKAVPPKSKTPETSKKRADSTSETPPKRYKKSRSQAKAIEEYAQNPIHHDIARLLQEVQPRAFGPILTDIHRLYADRLKDDDDFLRRQKNRIDKICTEEREACATITSQWTTDLEAAIKERVHSLQITPAAVADSDQSGKDQDAEKERQQRDMDSGINVVILKMLAQYHDRLRKKKKEVSRDLQRIETESFDRYRMGLGEQERQLLSLFSRLSMTIQENSIPRQDSRIDRAATMTENVNPNAIRNQSGSRAKLENKDTDTEMETGMEIKNLVTPPSGSKKRRPLPS